MGRCMIQIYIYRIKRLGPHIFPTITSQCVMFPSETVENQFARKSSTMSLGGNGTGHIMKFKLLGKDLLELNMHGIYIYNYIYNYIYIIIYIIIYIYIYWVIYLPFVYLHEHEPLPMWN
jgi:hypothetical protein